MYIREDQADIRLTVYDKNGNPVAAGDGNSWATYAGADLEAAGSKTRPGGMGYEIELGGPGTRADCTIEIQNSDTMISQHSFLESRVGRGRAQIVVTYLDDEGHTIPGAQFRINGRLKKAALPGQNYNSPTVGMYAVIVGADEQAG
jgi:hypothetical protein